MKVSLLGYGKMGKEIEKILKERGHEVILRIDENNPYELTPSNLAKSNVAIDFSIPQAAFQNIMMCFEADVPIVSGTTGWLDKFDEVTETCKSKNKSFFYASNYSLGVNLFFALNEWLARVMNKFPAYNVNIEEVHHNQKKDAPSGTAISLANDIINQLDRKNNWKLTSEVQEDVIGIKAGREGQVPGIHTVTYDSDEDFIQITHSAKSRKGFALGAVLAAEFLQDKKGVYSMKDLLKL
ncbi:MAG TPA: 4-hydroxy-tetrahydrodipicolinate reductase [Bacteroidales bacterium]|nr:4-hydroxy-tetrahydrodipicolinate reductase [Bacteroidales bacterium]